jgi:hypothetical protein
MRKTPKSHFGLLVAVLVVVDACLLALVARGRASLDVERGHHERIGDTVVWAYDD